VRAPAEAALLGQGATQLVCSVVVAEQCDPIFGAREAAPSRGKTQTGTQHHRTTAAALLWITICSSKHISFSGMYRRLQV